MKGMSRRSAGRTVCRCGKGCHQSSKGEWPSSWLAGKQAGMKNFAPCCPRNLGGCERSSGQPCSPQDFRRKKSKNGWHFSFAVEIQDCGHGVLLRVRVETKGWYD